jgi:hypothetical protein
MKEAYCEAGKILIFTRTNNLYMYVGIYMYL